MAIVLAVVAIVAGSAASASAIVGGEIDGTRHPNVAMIAFYQPDGRFRLLGNARLPDRARDRGALQRKGPGEDPRQLRSSRAGAAARCRRHGERALDNGLHECPSGWLAGTAHAHPLWDGELQLNDLHGGPVFHQGYLVGDTSFGGSQFCSGGNGGYYRLDTEDACPS